jgi:peptidoglycan/xylan/chitin deacetylase (PgdA/CDA1 family)
MRRIGIGRTAFELALVAAIVLLVVNRQHPQAGTGWRGHVIYGMPTREKVVALTYDDGPDPVHTRRILDLLDKYHVKATFFMIGKNMEAHPDVVREVIERGHAIGNHTYTHPHNIELDTEAQVIGELDRCEQVIERMTGSRAYLFRPPRGLVDGTVFAIASEENYVVVLWSICADHHDAKTPYAMAQRVLKHVRPGGIILAHDGETAIRWRDVAATPLIIEGLRKRGYRFVTVPELLKMR